MGLCLSMCLCVCLPQASVPSNQLNVYPHANNAARYSRNSRLLKLMISVKFIWSSQKGAKYTWSRKKLQLSRNNLLSLKNGRQTVSMKSQYKSYMIYQMATLPMTLNNPN